MGCKRESSFGILCRYLSIDWQEEINLGRYSEPAAPFFRNSYFLYELPNSVVSCVILNHNYVFSASQIIIHD